MGPSVLRDFTAPYSAVESFVYDALIAPAVVGMQASIESELLDALTPGARLLDVGCGGGHVALRIAGLRTDVEVTGLDISKEQISRAKKRATEQGKSMKFVVGSALDLPFETGAFDALISVASIKHWPDPLRGLSECVRVLKPGGKMAVIEADRGARVNDVKAFVDGWRIPSLVRPAARAFFRSVVAGQSFDLDDARELLAKLSVAQGEVRRIAGTPGLVILAQK